MKVKSENLIEPLTMKQTAEILNVSFGTVSNLIYSGELPSFKIRGARRISRGEIQTYLSAQISKSYHSPDNGVST